MKVKTSLQAGQPAAAWLVSLEKSAGDTLKALPAQAQALATSPQARELAGELLWWPFGPPRF